jgi:DNA ligase (NAD+)
MTTPFTTPEELHDAESLARRAADAYYTDGAVVVDDATYDTLVARIDATHDAHPEWGGDRTITGAVAAGTSDGGEVRHATPMLSLDNVFNNDDLAAWLAKSTPGWCVEPKLDGVAISARYTGGKLTVVATRGDGSSGEDVTGVARRATGLPHDLGADVDCEVRGEVVMTDEDFAAANEGRVASGKPAFVNPRNAVAGTLRKADSVAPLTFAAYDLVGVESHTSGIAWLEDHGVGTARQLVGVEAEVLDDPEKVAAAIDDLAARRAGLNVGIDGAVVKVDSRSAREALGANSRAPRWAVAYKYPADLRLTRLLAIDVSVGRTGVLTPVAVLDPVFVGGATVTYASLANPSEVVRKDLRVGDMVWVRRAGDVIPEVTGPQLDVRPDGLAAWVPPSKCPRCGSAVDTSSRRWRCGGRACGLAEAVAYAASRKALDIDGLGTEICDRLVDAGLVGDVADIFALDAAALTGLDRVGDTLAANLVANIADARTRPLDRVICALGITGTGSRLSRRLAAAFGSLDAVANATVDELAAVDGIGTVKAAVIAEELADLGGVVAKLHTFGVTTAVASPASTGAAGPLTGKRVLVTGKVPGMTREQAAEAVETLGGTSVSGVSGRTDLVVVGDGAGTSKLAKASELGVATMAAEYFASLMHRP